MADVRLQPWSEDDLHLLRMLLGDPQMMAHLGGPESEEQIVRRHQRYLHLPDHGADRMYKILWGPGSEAVGSVGYWRKVWRDRAVYETGWLACLATRDTASPQKQHRLRSILHGGKANTGIFMLFRPWRMPPQMRSAANSVSP